MLHERALLISLSISVWSARRYDEKASVEVAKANEATNAGRFNKLLIDTSHLKPVTQAMSALRDFHYANTLPWADDGRRLLPSRTLLTYGPKLNELIDAFNARVDEFVTKYPLLVAGERKRLGKMYDPGEYPRDIRSKFAVEKILEPVPSADDFRVDIGKDIEEAKRTLTELNAKREKAALDSLYTEARKLITTFTTKLADPEAVFRDSLLTNMEQFYNTAAALNYNEDLGFNGVLIGMLQLFKLDLKGLRKDPLYRDAAVQQADGLLRAVSWPTS